MRRKNRPDNFSTAPQGLKTGPQPETNRKNSARHLRVLQTGIDLQLAGKYPEAEFKYQLVLRDDPNNAQALNLLGTLAVEAEKFDISIEHLERAVKLDKKNPVFRNNLANSYILADVPEQAIPHLRRSISLNPRLVEPMMNLARAYRKVGRSNASIEWFRKVLRRAPDLDGAKSGLGGALIEIGRMDEAVETLRDCIETTENPVHAAVALSSAYRFTQDDQADIARIEGLLHVDKVEFEGKISLYYALGKINNDLKNYEQAFDHFVTAKSLDDISFNIGAYRKRIDRMIEYYTPDYYRERKGFGDPSERPVFIVGMPRSGTTLTEQIISSHPQVYGAGELSDIVRILGRISPEGKDKETFYENVSRMKPADSIEVAAVYLRALNRHSRSALRVVDKMPHNFEALGLIALLFPNAKVIYCRRDAMDNCVSCYMHHFSKSHAYNSDLKTLGAYYHEHVRLMDHWKSALPIDILESRYEDLIADQEGASRRLIDFIGLEWDEACLRFNEQDRSVRTLSRWQVRQPIYKTSMKRWKRYGSRLDPLKEALGDLFEDA